MADDTYAKLAVKLAERDPASVDAAVRQDVLEYFSNLNQPFDTKRHEKEWQATVAAVEKLRAEPAPADANRMKK